MAITNIKIIKEQNKDNTLLIAYNNGQKVIKIKASNAELMDIEHEIKRYMVNDFMEGA